MRRIIPALLAVLPQLAIAAEAQAPSPPLVSAPPAEVREIGERGAPALPRLGLLVSPPTAVVTHQLGLDATPGVVIDYVEPGGPAESAGLHRFDLILKLDDQLVVGADQLRVLLGLRKAGERVAFEVFRSGKRERVEIALCKQPEQPTPTASAVAGPVSIGPREGEGWRGYSITLEDAVQRRVSIADERGQMIYQGGYDTPEQRGRIPEQARSALDAILARGDAGERAWAPAAPLHVGGVLTAADGVTATASSTHVSTRAGDGEQPVAALIDGDARTRWSSAYADEQEVVIDLGKPQALSTLVLLWEAAAAKRYDVQLSEDGKAWTAGAELADRGAGPRDDLIDLHGASARYLKLRLHERSTAWGFSLYEALIFPKR